VSERRQAAASLLRVMEAVGTTLDLREILYRLVEITVEATGADRAVVLLLEGGALVPTAVAGRRVNRDLFRTFKAMPGVPVDEVDERRRMVWGDELVVIEDARSSPVVPDGWVEAFGTTSLAIAPLTTDDGLAGILAVDHTERHSYDEAELEMLQAISHAGRIAIANTALRSTLERVGAQHEVLLSGIAELSTVASSSLDEALESVVRVAHRLFPMAACSISVTAGDRTALAGRHAVAGEGDGHRTVFPVHGARGPLGYLTLTGSRALRAEELALLDVFARHVALAVGRAVFVASLRDELRCAQVLSRLSDVVTGATTLPSALRRLNEELCHELGFECGDAAFRERRDAEDVVARRADLRESALVARFGAGVPSGPVAVDTAGTLAVAIPVNGRAAGLLTVRPLRAPAPLTADQLAVTTAIASGIGDAVARARLRRGLREATRRLERTDAMADVADELDRRLGRTLHDVDRALRRLLADEPPSSELRARVRAIQDLVAAGRDELHTAARARGQVDVRAIGLESALQDVVVAFGDASGVATNFRVRGERTELKDDVEDALHDVAFDALAFVADAGRATAVTVSLTYGDPVVLAVRDDGVGLAQRTSDDEDGIGSRVHHGIGAIRARLASVGGSMVLESARPRGVRLVARVPRVAAPIDVRGAEAGAVVPFRER
jgi:GAF domain-containing protein